MTKWRWVRTLITSASVAFSVSRLPIWEADATVACLLTIPIIGVAIIALDQKEKDACVGRRRQVLNEDRKMITFDLHSTTF